ncbi:N-acetyltransferase family protein [Bacillus sp. 1P06AnD]|uniref:GNAT family N-acetyltransferase n=1 Tax=Bacillus sp. 1P06AnD TaxID=3132208 RepID=UPI0039A279DC
MIIQKQEYCVKGLAFIIRSAEVVDAKELSAVRLQIDGETENLDREKGEAYIDEHGFKAIIKRDSENSKHLLLVAESEGRIVGFARCEGSELRRFSHKCEFGVCVVKEFWGYGIGKQLLQEAIKWADGNDIKKMVLFVTESNEKAVRMYKKAGFMVEGILKKDKLLADGSYHNTIAMGRIIE